EAQISKPRATAERRNFKGFYRRPPTNLRNVVAIVPEKQRGGDDGYNDVGGRAPRLQRCPASMVFRRRAVPLPETAVSELLDLIPLWFLPSGGGIGGAERRRTGRAPSAVLDALLQEHGREEPPRRAELRARATAALTRARATGIAPVGWLDASYPV